jgi:hypothetical protein
MAQTLDEVMRTAIEAYLGVAAGPHSLQDLQKAYYASVLSSRVHPGQSIQAAINHAVTGELVGYRRAAFVVTGAPTTGDSFRIIVGGHPTEADSDHIYEFTDGAVSIPGAHAVAADGSDVMTILAANQGTGGDSSIDTFETLQIDQTFYVWSNLPWEYVNCTVDSEAMTVAQVRQVRDPESDPITIEVSPGTYSERITLYSGITIKGTRNVIITADTEAGTVDMDSHSSIVGCTVVNTSAGGGSIGIQAVNPHTQTRDVTIQDCHVTAKQWAVGSQSGGDVKIHLNTGLLVKNNYISSPNPIYVYGGYSKSVFQDNTIWHVGTTGNCYAMLDTDKSPTLNFKNKWVHNTVHLDAPDHPYGLNLGGWGHAFEHNSVTIYANALAADRPLAFVELMYAAALHTSESKLSPIVIAHNKFEFVAVDTDNPLEVIALRGPEGALDTPGRISDVIMADNDFISNYPGVTNYAIKWSPSNATEPSVITIMEGGLRGFEAGVVDTNATIVLQTSVHTMPFYDWYDPRGGQLATARNIMGGGAANVGWQPGRFTRIKKLSLIAQSDSATGEILTATAYKNTDAQTLVAAINNAGAAGLKQADDAAHPVDLCNGNLTDRFSLKVTGTENGTTFTDQVILFEYQQLS